MICSHLPIDFTNSHKKKKLARKYYTNKSKAQLNYIFIKKKWIHSALNWGTYISSENYLPISDYFLQKFVCVFAEKKKQKQKKKNKQTKKQNKNKKKLIKRHDIIPSYLATVYHQWTVFNHYSTPYVSIKALEPGNIFPHNPSTTKK